MPSVAAPFSFLLALINLVWLLFKLSKSFNLPKIIAQAALSLVPWTSLAIDIGLFLWITPSLEAYPAAIKWVITASLIGSTLGMTGITTITLGIAMLITLSWIASGPKLTTFMTSKLG